MIGRHISHYKILEKLGEGGMGVVYKAEDTRLKRIVALKFLSTNLTADADAKERFIQEAQAASALEHPNICNIHEINETDDGRLYIVMACYEGQTLKDRLAAGPLPIEQAIEYACQMAEGLAEAHEKGIVHRDIKPANIMITEKGQVKIMDFGLAKLAGQAHLTQSGSTLGTAAYMSPEQARGEKIDHRTDIWSLGIVLYEMITGQLPFKGEYEQAVIYSILNEEPPPVSGLRREIPVDLERLVQKTLAKNPWERFASAGEISAVLNSLAKKRETERDQQRSGGPETSPSIAVLPFVNMSPDPENEYFSDGLAEDIIDALTQVPGLRVMARTSAFSFRGKQADVREIGAKLNVEHILEGSVRRAGNRLRVTAQLVKASDGYHLWSQRFDREMNDVFAIQDEISQAIVENLRVRLAAGRPLIKPHTENMDAYHLFLRGRYFLWRATTESLAKGKEYFEQAIARDPDYALAYVGMARYYFGTAFWGFKDPKEALPRIKSAAMEAFSRDDALADVRSALGLAKGVCDFDWVGAEKEFRRALEFNPASPNVHYEYGFYCLRPMGRLDEASSQLQLAAELDPLSALYNALVAYLSYARGQYDLAIAQQRRTIELDPGWYVPHWLLAMVYEHMGLYDEAIGAAQKACELSGRNAVSLGILALAYGLADHRGEAQELLEELTKQSQATYVPPHAIAAAYRGLGDVAQALEWLEKGVEERDLLVVTGLKAEPRYFPLRGHPRYQALLRKMNLEP